MNESLIKYLAGLLDADGSLSFTFKEDINRPGNCFIGLRLSLAAANTVDKLGFVPSLPTLTGMGTLTIYKEQFITWFVSKRADLEMLLPRLIKHMVIKAKHWQWLLDTWRLLRTDNNTITLNKRDELKEASKTSRRINVGPIKPKNHPTWAWTAGYLDGDGSYSYRNHHGRWHIKVAACAHINDVSVLEFLQNAYGGTIADHNKDGSNKLWTVNLGPKNKTFALNFLPKIYKHSRLKQEKILKIIHHHQQRLSVLSVSDNVSDSLNT